MSIWTEISVIIYPLIHLTSVDLMCRMMHWGLHEEHIQLFYRLHITSFLLVYLCVPILRLWLDPIFHLWSVTYPEARPYGWGLSCGEEERLGVSTGTKLELYESIQETVKLYSVYMLQDIHWGDYPGGHTNSYNWFTTLGKTPTTLLVIVINRSIIADQLQRHCDYGVRVRYHRTWCL